MATVKKPPKKINNIIRLSIFWVIIALIVFGLAAFMLPNEKLKEIPISDVISGANSGDIVKIQGSGNDLKITRKDQDKPTEKSYIQGGVSSLLNDNV